MESSINSLLKVVEEKEVLRKYYVKKQRDNEEDIKAILIELVADDREYSEEDTLKRVRLEKTINDYIYLNERFNEHVNSLSLLTDQYFKKLIEKSKLEESSKEDEEKLNRFERTYKSTYLFKFGYSSNPEYSISIQREEPFRYLPVYKSFKDAIPQSIRVNSSASDFVRNIWAYTLALLTEGRNHPGIIIFDEPGQHRTDSESLKSLFEESAKIKDKQIIIFTSVDKQLSEDDKIDLTKLLKDLKREDDYFIYELDEVGKCIKILE